jgi:hypothetical protein
MGNSNREEAMNGLLDVLENLTHEAISGIFFIQTVGYRDADPGFQIPAIRRRSNARADPEILLV